MIYISLVLAIVMIIYSSIEGVREAWYYHIKNVCLDIYKTKIPNEHFTFSLQRGLFISSLSVINTVILFHPENSSLHNVLNFILSNLGYMLIFSFFHDGEYYTERNHLDPYQYSKKWWDQKNSLDKGKPGSAIFDPNPITRTLMMVIGLIILYTLVVI